MSESAGKHINIYLNYPKGKSKHICIINVPRHSSDECKVLGNFGSKYIKSRPTKDHGQTPVPGKKFNRQNNNNGILNSAVDEIILHENNKVSTAK